MTINPEARFDKNDVRALDKEYAILLTSSLINKINVSISELPIINGVFLEDSSRYVGYVAARDTEGYIPVPIEL